METIEGLEGKTIVIAGSQKTNEMGTIIEKQGGVPLVRSLQGLTFLDESQIAEPLKQLAKQGADWIILTTGVGADMMVTASEKLGIKDAVLAALTQAKLATRGYKTAAFLKRTGLKAIVSDDDGTVNGLIRNLEGHDFTGQRVMIQLHGEPSPELEQFLKYKGAAAVQSILPYRHTPPAADTIELLLTELSDGRVDAVCFTTAVQVKYLFNYAIETGRKDSLLTAFQGKAVAAAVGKVTAEALQHYGVTRIVVPELERMGAMIIELTRYYGN